MAKEAPPETPCGCTDCRCRHAADVVWDDGTAECWRCVTDSPNVHPVPVRSPSKPRPGPVMAPLHMQVLEDPDPETVTRHRRESNEWLAQFGAPPRGPSKYELDFYAKVGRTPPAH